MEGRGEEEAERCERGRGCKGIYQWKIKGDEGGDIYREGKEWVLGYSHEQRGRENLRESNGISGKRSKRDGREVC